MYVFIFLFKFILPFPGHCLLVHFYIKFVFDWPRKVQVGNDKESVQSERNTTPKTAVGKNKLTIRYIYLEDIVSQICSYFQVGGQEKMFEYYGHMHVYSPWGRET